MEHITLSSSKAGLGNALSFEKAGVKSENLKAYNADSVVELRFPHVNVVLLWLRLSIAMKFLPI